MNADKALKDLILEAIRHEIYEREFYLALGRKVKNPLVRRKINGLADDEMEHRQTLSRLFWSQTGKEPGRMDPEPSILDMPDIDGTSLSELFQAAMEMEKMAGKKYSRMAKKTENKRTAAFLEYLAQFEREHYQTLSAELENILRLPGWADQGPAD